MILLLIFFIKIESICKSPIKLFYFILNFSSLLDVTLEKSYAFIDWIIFDIIVISSNIIGTSNVNTVFASNIVDIYINIVVIYIICHDL